MPDTLTSNHKSTHNTTQRKNMTELSLKTQVLLTTGLATAGVVVLASDWTLERDQCPASNLRMWILVFVALRCATDPQGHWARGFFPGMALAGWGMYEISTACPALESSMMLTFVKVFTWALGAVAVLGMTVFGYSFVAGFREGMGWHTGASSPRASVFASLRPQDVGALSAMFNETQRR